EGYGIKKKIYAVSNGIELELFKKDSKTGLDFRKKYGYTKDDKVIVGIGLYIARKGIVDFIELARRLPEYKFIWFGYSPLAVATKEVKKAFKNLPENIKFPGYVKQEDIKSALNGCDIYLFPTYEETEGIPVIEAAACEATMLIRDIPIFDDWVRNNVDAYKAKNIDDFEKKIKKIINKELPRLGNNAYKLAQERDLKIVGKQLN
ncbi:MAG: glycosyltransferase family 4 protein, partial [Muribaculaceae bacterium]|nr:glycosyltransferase family 4 protein [Muribaculaceae bacterium]